MGFIAYKGKLYADEVIIDTELDDESGNALANRAIAEKFDEVEDAMDDLEVDIAAKQDKLPTKIYDKYLHTNATTGDLEWVAAGGNVDDVKVNGTSVVTSKVANVTVPTKTSDITNDSGFITNSYHDSTKEDAGKITISGTAYTASKHTLSWTNNGTTYSYEVVTV